MLPDYNKKNTIQKKASKEKYNLNFVENDTFDVLARSDKELVQMASSMSKRKLDEILQDDDCSDLF